jgi:hypothetical protein
MSQCGSPDRKEGKSGQKGSGKRNARKATWNETWVYDCGPDEFIYLLRFSKSRLALIEEGGRGTRNGLPCPMGCEWTRRKEMARGAEKSEGKKVRR